MPIRARKKYVWYCKPKQTSEKINSQLSNIIIFPGLCMLSIIMIEVKISNIVWVGRGFTCRLLAIKYFIKIEKSDTIEQCLKISSHIWYNWTTLIHATWGQHCIVFKQISLRGWHTRGVTNTAYNLDHNEGRGRV